MIIDLLDLKRKKKYQEAENCEFKARLRYVGSLNQPGLYGKTKQDLGGYLARQACAFVPQNLCEVGIHRWDMLIMAVLGRWRQEDPQCSLVSQSSKIDELQLQ